MTAPLDNQEGLLFAFEPDATVPLSVRRGGCHQRAVSPKQRRLIGEPRIDEIDLMATQIWDGGRRSSPDAAKGVFHVSARDRGIRARPMDAAPAGLGDSPARGFVVTDSLSRGGAPACRPAGGWRRPPTAGTIPTFVFHTPHPGPHSPLDRHPRIRLPPDQLTSQRATRTPTP